MEHEPDNLQARADALVGTTLGGRYRLDAVLGIGAMGAVFRGFHTGLEREIAVKVLHRSLMSSEEMRARFSREAAAISKLDHPNCVRVSDFGSDDDHQYLVMELLQGRPLSNDLGEPFDPVLAIEIVDEVLAGLEHAHGHGLVHRDVKPDNIFLADVGDDTVRPKLLDFGIVKLQENQGGRQLTQVGMIFGTPHFMSPEQATGQDVDARADLYATGILLYILLSGTRPFDAEDPVKVLRQQIREPPPPLPVAVPGPLRELVERLMAKEPDARYPDAAAARAALATIAKALQPSKVPTMPAPSQGGASSSSGGPTWWPLSPTGKLIAGLVGVVMLALVISIATGGGDDEAPPPVADAKAVQDQLKQLLGGAEPEGEASGGEAKDEAGAEETGEGEPDPNDPERSIQAILASVDALIEAGKYDSARIMLGPQLNTHGDEARLHWRMGQVLTALRGADNRAEALKSYVAAVVAEPALLDDEGFWAELLALLKDAKLREAAVGVAIEHLGPRIDDELLAWLNTQATPLSHRLRQRVIGHLQANQRGGEINRPLQRALDLWQAGTAEDPCAVFSGALREAQEQPDSFLLGTVRAVSVPEIAGPDETTLPCQGSQEELERVRKSYEQRFVGIEPVVPRAYRKRRKAPEGSNRKKKRRR